MIEITFLEKLLSLKKAVKENGTIYTSDENAVEKYELKIEYLEKMKELIKEFRKVENFNGRDKACEILSDKIPVDDIADILNHSNYYYSSNHLNTFTTKIRSYKSKIASYKRLKSTLEISIKINSKMGEISVLEEEGRINVYFPDKPSQDVIDALKQSGIAMKWSIRYSCWTRRKTQNTDKYFLNRLVEILKDA